MARKQNQNAAKADSTVRQNEDRETALGKLLAFADPSSPDKQETRLPSGRSVQAMSMPEAGDEELVTVTGPDGNVELSVRFTQAGPVLTFESAAIQMKTKGRIGLECGKLDIKTEHGIEMSSGGDLVQQAEGQHIVRAGRMSVTEAKAVAIASKRGDVKLQANDNLRLDGEKVLLNS